MRKLLTIILVLMVLASFVACGGNTVEVDVDDPENLIETEEEIKVEEDKQEDKAEEKNENTADTNTQKPQNKPQEQKPAQKPAEKPVEAPEKQPEQKPAEKPEPVATTLGKTLLADFKAKAASGMSAQAIAEGLLANSAIKFSGGAMPVEEGFLSGFDNAEIKGFKSGVMFAPMIGSIPFVGYVFELENAADAPAFISNLENNANLRWNICVAADEMVTGTSGNKVFFVMCPTTLEE